MFFGNFLESACSKNEEQNLYLIASINQFVHLLYHATNDVISSLGKGILYVSVQISTMWIQFISLQFMFFLFSIHIKTYNYIPLRQELSEHRLVLSEIVEIIHYTNSSVVRTLLVFSFWDFIKYSPYAVSLFSSHRQQLPFI